MVHLQQAQILSFDPAPNIRVNSKEILVKIVKTDPTMSEKLKNVAKQQNRMAGM